MKNFTVDEKQKDGANKKAELEKWKRLFQKTLRRQQNMMKPQQQELREMIQRGKTAAAGWEECDYDTTAAAKDIKKGESSAAAATKCRGQQDTAAIAAGKAEAAAPAHTAKGKASTAGTHGTVEAAAAAVTGKIDENMRRSQYDENEQLDEKDEEIKALIKERRKINKKGKDQMKNVSKKIKKCIRDNKWQEFRKGYSEYWKNSRESRAFRTSNLRGKGRSFQK